MSNHSAKFEAVHALLNAGDLAGAKAACQRLVQAAAREPGAQSLMAQILYRMGQPAPALHYASVASQLAPRDAGLLTQWANLLLIAGKHDQALQTLGKIPGLLESDPYALSLATSAHLDANRCVAALEAATKAHALQPDDPGLTSQLAACYLNIGEAPKAFELVEPFIRTNPAPTMLSGLALISNYVPGMTRAQQESLHVAYGQRLSQLSPVPTRSFAHLLTPKKCLRVAIISPDLRSHSVASFIEPLFIHHDRELLELVIYQTNAVADDVTKRLRKHIDTWHVMDNISDEALAERIYADKIDIAIELSGHTHAHCLPCMHLRPAPLQLTYLGYPNITGLESMDYRIADSITDPVSVDSQAQNGSDTHAKHESFARLDPIFLCYQPPTPHHPPTLAPSQIAASRSPDDTITFGSFNNVQKLNDVIISLWADILKRVPNSRLVLKGVALTEPALQSLLLARFTALGLTPDRIEILPRAPSSAAHLALYSRIDIALDTYPYGGTTTTCEALAMGVPVITLSGSATSQVAPHAARVGASILTQMGMTELIATNEQQYVHLACSLAQDRQRLAALRSSMREKFLASPLCDGPGFAERFGALLHSLWEAKLATLLQR